MSVQNAGSIIREARTKAGLTQEQLSEGICSTLSLSRIENNTAGVSPSTFQALMAHAGSPCEAYPAFANRTDFDCFYALKRVRFFLDSWQLQNAYDELAKIEAIEWANNKFYYQEWLLLHSKLQFRSGCGNHQQIYDTVLDALHISRPQFNSTDFRRLLLTLTEIELCILLAQESLYLGNTDMCMEICTQISAYLSGSQIAFLEKDRLLAENAIVYTKYLIAISDYKNALMTADKFRHLMVKNLTDAPLLELTFLTALGYYYTNDTEYALTYFKAAFFSAHSIESCYATICRNYVQKHFALSLPDGISAFADIPLVTFPCKKSIDTITMNDGTYDFFAPDVLTLGSLIRELRIEQKVSQTILCQGLCSKSKLSKIENENQQPEIILAQALLQRLGISDLVFTFYGNEKESVLQNLISQSKKVRLADAQSLHKLTNDISQLCTDNDSLYLQYADFKMSNCIKDASLRISNLMCALQITLPDFDFKHITDYHFSLTELNILNHLCYAYYIENPPVGIQYFYKLLEYFECNGMDILALKRILPVTLGMLVQGLYAQKRFSELKYLSTYFLSPTIKSSIYFEGHIFFHYCQALGELNEIDLAEKYGNYSYQILSIIEVHPSMHQLKNTLFEDFKITLL